MSLEDSYELGRITARTHRRYYNIKTVDDLKNYDKELTEFTELIIKKYD